jgi:broad specificity phosphatase PhoE
LTTFYLIRHGEPTYKPVDERNFIGHGRDLAPLTEGGIKGVKETAKDCRLKNSEIIVSSPYTRALQTAAILSKELGIDLEVDVDLHEWIPDIINFQHKTTQDCIDLCKDFESYNGIPPENQIKVWETAESMERRMNSVLQKYTKYQRVIVVCHGMVIRTIKYQEKIAHSEIIEYILKNK